jgi:hypothetical protein
MNTNGDYLGEESARGGKERMLRGEEDGSMTHTHMKTA